MSIKGEQYILPFGMLEGMASHTMIVNAGGTVCQGPKLVAKLCLEDGDSLMNYILAKRETCNHHVQQVTDLCANVEQECRLTKGMLAHWRGEIVDVIREGYVQFRGEVQVLQVTEPHDAWCSGSWAPTSECEPVMVSDAVCLMSDIPMDTPNRPVILKGSTGRMIQLELNTVVLLFERGFEAGIDRGWWNKLKKALAPGSDRRLRAVLSI